MPPRKADAALPRKGPVALCKAPAHSHHEWSVMTLRRLASNDYTEMIRGFILPMTLALALVWAFTGSLALGLLAAAAVPAVPAILIALFILAKR